MASLFPWQPEAQGQEKSNLEVDRVGNPAWDPQEFRIPQLG